MPTDVNGHELHIGDQVSVLLTILSFEPREPYYDLKSESVFLLPLFGRHFLQCFNTKQVEFVK